MDGGRGTGWGVAVSLVGEVGVGTAMETIFEDSARRGLKETVNV